MFFHRNVGAVLKLGVCYCNRASTATSTAWPHHTALQRAPHRTSARERLPLASLVGGTKPPDMSIPSHGRHANDCRGISHPSFSSFSRRNFTRGPVKGGRRTIAARDDAHASV